MVSHILTLGIIQSVRSLAGLAMGIFLLWQGMGHIPAERVSRLEPGDRTVFVALGAGWAALSLLRGGQGASTLVLVAAARRRRPAPAHIGRFVRRLGIAVALIDVIDLTGFPVTTGCGTYGLLVYRHPEALDFFEGVFSGSPAAEVAGVAGPSPRMG